jgi:hypothetical protein
LVLSIEGLVTSAKISQSPIWRTDKTYKTYLHSRRSEAKVLFSCISQSPGRAGAKLGQWKMRRDETRQRLRPNDAEPRADQERGEISAARVQISYLKARKSPPPGGMDNLRNRLLGQPQPYECTRGPRMRIAWNRVALGQKEGAASTDSGCLSSHALQSPVRLHARHARVALRNVRPPL